MSIKCACACWGWVCVCVCVHGFLFHVKFSLIKYEVCEICRFSSNSMPFVYMAPLTLVVITMRGLAFQLCAIIPSISGLYLSLNSMVWMVRSDVRIIGPFCSYMEPVSNIWS